ncbi:3-phosphoshikimate 1-carboxyvinyltransferase [Cognatiluteimonas telluris]|uniref:3-phosphoshikimate 1-carboxyvinyltransferase n=1 Tax=Cognatiluteimonas telluris TaxID=1104775 RepID=UPI001FAF7D1D|nr:3-phosphoshikimate 1-carboxyvinyltransferase [Lysobacter telluris]
MSGAARQDWVAGRRGPLTGTLRVPGDKSVSHRAVMLAALADGISRIEGFLEGEDTRATASVFARMGVRFEAPAAGVRIVHGVGVDGLRAPDGPLDCGNAGTAMRLLAGVLSAQAFDSVLVGDASLSRRPMRRVIDPLQQMGARIASSDGLPPLRIHGARLHGIDYRLPVASAQVKSALLLAGLWADGDTCVHEPHPTRDYTERMLRAFGVAIDYAPGTAHLRGGQRLRACELRVPTDFSSAAFFIVAATLVPGSALRIERVGMNPRRTGLLQALRAMGADIEAHAVDGSDRDDAVADLVVRHAPLHGIDLPVEIVPDMIDEFPALFVAAACATGTTVVRGAAELRVKESDRIATMVAGLRALGIACEESADGATIHGGRLRGGRVDSHGDHRVAMAFAVAGQRADGDVRIADVANVATSFPGFDALAADVGFGLRTAGL